MVNERVSFEEAIAEPRLLKNAFDELSCPQQVVLRAFYGLPLSANGAKGDELYFWSILQGFAEYDELFYPTRVTRIPYVAKRYEDLVAVLGRRSGKTDRIASLAVAYEATLGGHTRYVRPGQEALILFIAQDKDAATQNLPFVAQNLETSPILRKEIVSNDISKIQLKNGIKIIPETPSIKSARGFAIPGVLMDEVGFWYKDAKSANPDFEVERAVMSAQNQFEHPFRIKTTTPWTMEGIAYEAHTAGTEGRKIRCGECDPITVAFCPHKADEREEFEDVLVVHAPTTVMTGPASGMKIPIVSHKRILKKFKKDKEGFQREEGAQFIRTEESFLNDRAVELAIDRGVFERPKDTKQNCVYVAALDPAFRNDSFAFTIGHADPKFGIVQDYLHEWVPEPGNKLMPGPILDEIQQKLMEFGISVVYGDQYQLESLQQLALDREFALVGIDFTGKSKARICGSLATLINQRRLRLLDNEVQKRQLLKLKKVITDTGTIQIFVPQPDHDDVAMVTSLMTHQAVWLLPTDVEQVEEKEPTREELCFAQVQKRIAEVGMEEMYGLTNMYD